MRLPDLLSRHLDFVAALGRVDRSPLGLAGELAISAAHLALNDLKLAAEVALQERLARYEFRRQTVARRSGD